MLGTIEKTSNPWEEMCQRWELFAPPGRPSSQDIQIYKQYIDEIIKEKRQNGQKKFHVLILGATPEIRDMLATYDNIQVVLVDITIDMILAMTELMQKKPKNEIWIRSNWITVPLQSDMFDVIISDLVICNIDPEKHEDFFLNIIKLLKIDGYWINRIYCIDENTSIRSMEQLFDEYKNKEELTNKDVNNFRSMAGLNYWDPQTGYLNWMDMLKEMDKYKKNGEYVHKEYVIKELLDQVYELFYPFNKKYWIEKRRKTERLFQNYFVIKQIYHDKTVIPLREKGYYIYDMIPKR